MTYISDNNIFRYRYDKLLHLNCIMQFSEIRLSLSCNIDIQIMSLLREDYLEYVNELDHGFKRLESSLSYLLTAKHLTTQLKAIYRVLQHE